MTDDTELFADGDVVDAFLDDDVEAAEFLRLPGLGTVSILFPFPELSEMSGTGGGAFPASNAVLMALKFLDTKLTFFGPELAARVDDDDAADDSKRCLDSKIEIRSEIGFLLD